MLLEDEDAFNAHLHAESYLDFSSLLRTMWTLIIDGTLMLDYSGPMMTQLMFHSKWHFVFAGILFNSYALISALLILQMLIGVLCDVVAQVNDEQRDSKAIALVRQELANKLRKLNNGAGKITRYELHQVVVDPRTRIVLDKLRINRIFLLQMEEIIFDLTPSITIRAALDLLLMCRSEKVVNVEVLAGGFSFIGKELSRLRTQLQDHIDYLSGTTLNGMR
jgi:hypothetical protein